MRNRDVEHLLDLLSLRCISSMQINDIHFFFLSLGRSPKKSIIYQISESIDVVFLLELDLP